MTGMRLSAVKKREITAAILTGNRSLRSISREHNVSISTVSRLAKEAGYVADRPGGRARSRKVKDPENSFDHLQRVKYLDKFWAVIGDQVDGGGLSPVELKNLAQASQSVLEVRRQEDLRDPEPGVADKDNDGLVSISLGDMRVAPNTYIGQEMIKQGLVEGDVASPHTYGAAREDEDADHGGSGEKGHVSS